MCQEERKEGGIMGGRGEQHCAVLHTFMPPFCAFMYAEYSIVAQVYICHSNPTGQVFTYMLFIPHSSYYYEYSNIYRYY